MERWSEESPLRTALTVAGVYAVLGVLWILFSDGVVSALAESEAQLTRLQSVKGVAFIVASALVIFLLVRDALRELTETNAELEVALRQTDRLHRILRHNLRNSCQVIAGNVELLAERTDEANEPFLDAIRDHTERLQSLSRKSIRLQGFLDAGRGNVGTTDLVATVEARAAAARERHPEATVAVDCPDEARVRAHEYVDDAVGELVENAVRHNDSADPHVWLTVRRESDAVTLTVADDGPGIPPVERRVLEQKTETQTEHSQGLGLWLAYLTVHYSRGTFSVGRSERGGAAVELSFPAA